MADAAVSLRVDVTVTPSRWPGHTGPTLSEQVRGYLAAELGVVEQLGDAGIDVDVVSFASAADRNEARHG
jgi:hypothetical protein